MGVINATRMDMDPDMGTYIENGYGYGLCLICP